VTGPRLVCQCCQEGNCVVSQLYDLRLLIEEKIKSAGLDPMEMKGKIGLRSGKLLALISPSTPDDPWRLPSSSRQPRKL
jgi:hypothetical protein